MVEPEIYENGNITISRVVENGYPSMYDICVGNFAHIKLSPEDFESLSDLMVEFRKERGLKSPVKKSIIDVAEAHKVVLSNEIKMQAKEEGTNV